MPICAQCGSEHDLLDPTFRYPEAWAQLAEDERNKYGQIDSDLCGIALPGTSPRHFMRGVIPVDVRGSDGGVWWGVWAEVAEEDFQRTVALWSDPEQEAEPPFEGVLANALPSYPETLGLALEVQLTGPTTRPRFILDDADHPFVRDCVVGVDLHQAAEWNRLLSGGGAT